MRFEELYNSYFECIYKFVYRITGNTETAEDVAQEAFLKLYSHTSSGLPVHSPKSWLYRVATNLSYNHIKRKNNYHKIKQGLELQNSVNQSIESEIIEKEEIRMIRAAVARLNKRDQVILQLYQDELSYAEIAEVIGVKKTSVGKILSRAIKKCASYIER
jgi:RNA polymerase sigma-70 factor (ECF subfamily)